jgi:hypothetical protein
MNARAVAKLVGAKIGTLNAWIARGYIRGLEVGTSGKRRDIDAQLALQIAIFAELTRFGVTPEEAALLVPRDQELPRLSLPGVPMRARHGGRSDWLIVIRPGTEVIPGYQLRGALTWRVASLADFENDEKFSAPAAALVINIPQLAARVRQAELEWQQSRGAKS